MCFVKYFNRGIFGLFCLWKLLILFPPAKYDFNDPVSLNAFASKAATSAVILGHSSNVSQIFLLYIQSVNSVFANLSTLFHFPTLFHFFFVAIGEGASQVY